MSTVYYRNPVSADTHNNIKIWHLYVRTTFNPRRDVGILQIFYTLYIYYYYRVFTRRTWKWNLASHLRPHDVVNSTIGDNYINIHRSRTHCISFTVTIL